MNQQDLRAKIDKVIEILKQDMGTIRTGRATPALVENIYINAYGGTARLRVMELATIGASDAQTLVITPFDHTTIHEIEKGIQEANVGLNPIVDGQILRINLPALSTERREELIKSVKHKLENGRVMIRQVRHDGMATIKKQHDAKEISDDEKVRDEKDVQKLVDDTMALIDAMGKHKEAELLQI